MFGQTTEKFRFRPRSRHHRTGRARHKKNPQDTYKIRPLPASCVPLQQRHSMNRARDSHLLKEALTIRFLNGSSMDVVLRLIHDCIGALHKRHRKEKEKLNP